MSSELKQEYVTNLLPLWCKVYHRTVQTSKLKPQIMIHLEFAQKLIEDAS